MSYFRGKNLAVLSDLLDLLREIGGRYGMDRIRSPYAG